MLILVPTPVGNLGDITIRAVQALKDAGLILAEDTRTSRKLLEHYQIKTPVQSFHAFNEHKTFMQYVEKMLNGETIALISDAGTPGISDPGYLLIRECIRADIRVTCLPGSTAFVPALVMSGLPCDRFYFEGFLPHKKGRKTRMEFLSKLEVTWVIYESPHRIKKCVEEICKFCGEDRPMAIVREISKVYEEVIRGSAGMILEQCKELGLKGEMVVVVGKYQEKENQRLKNGYA
ncbi:MAG TPA: 16S rRNA (cytidine(1402)-2'-O)-methyltransferase [Saprospiraceae bacterium]|nr:16S rRNA (cytidine(1402)-2'-O)-methyltransferase [Saprospiraceae bacterium]